MDGIENQTGLFFFPINQELLSLSLLNNNIGCSSYNVSTILIICNKTKCRRQAGAFELSMNNNMKSNYANIGVQCESVS